MAWYNPKTWRRGAADPAPKRRSYEGAGKGRRTDGWITPRTDANAEVRSAGHKLADRGSDLARNNAWAAKAVETLAANLVGDGIVPRSATGDAALDAEVDRLWAAWAEEAETTGQLDVYGAQELIARAMVERGECLVRRRPRRAGDGYTVPLQIQVLEADHLDETRDGALGDDGRAGRVVAGVQFDPTETRTGYWLRRYHPGDQTAPLTASTSSSFVPAADVAHVYRILRPGQVRGTSALAPVMIALRDLADYTDAERVRKKVEACIVGVKEGGESADVFPAAQDDEQSPVTDSDGNPIGQLAPGIILHTRAGESFSVHTPGTVGGYAEYRTTELQAIAAGLGMTYELLSGDLSRVNFSSIRAGLIEFRRFLTRIQRRTIIRLGCQPIWQWFIDAAIAAGKLPERDAYPVIWSPPRFEEVDRLKEAAADLLELRSGLVSRRSVLADRGRDYEVTTQEIADDLALLDRLGVTLDSDPRRTSKAGTAQDYLRAAAAGGVIVMPDEAAEPSEDDPDDPTLDE